MYLLQLFHQSDPAQPVAAHLAVDGLIRIGRDPAADWVVPDPDCEISRTHLELACRDGTLTMTPLGTNGVFDAAGERLVHGKPRPLAPGDTIGFGRYRMKVETAPATEGNVRRPDRTILAAPFGSDLDIPVAWPDPAPSAAETGDALLDAFCRGADLDISTFAGADPAEILERAGQIYRQAVLGFADLTRARSEIKADHGLERTTIGPDRNNPFRWAPPRRLAVDLLLGEAGFMAGPDAIRAAGINIKKHMMATLEGFESCVNAIVSVTDPATIEQRATAQRTLLQNHGSACWAAFKVVHADLMTPGPDGENTISKTFAVSYRAALDTFENPAGE